MNIKKLANFIIPLRIFSKRNLTSLGLVFLLFIFYLLCGGKIETQPLQEALRNVHGSEFNAVVMAPVERVVKDEIKQTEKIPEGKYVPPTKQQIVNNTDIDSNTRNDNDANDLNRLNARLRGKE